MHAPPAIVELAQELAQLKSGRDIDQMGEDLRSKIVPTIFRQLGWDVGNERELSFCHRDVISGSNLNLPSSTPAPNYLFQIDGRTKFFIQIETTHDQMEGRYHLRNCGYNAQLPLSIFADTEALTVYICSDRPPQRKEPLEKTGYKHVKYSQLPQRWGEISDLLSRKRVQGGSLEEAASRQASRKKVQPIHEVLFAATEKWRKLLAENIHSKNPDIDKGTLNRTVQETMIRILFLRTGEDQRRKTTRSLHSLIEDNQIHRDLDILFQTADNKRKEKLFSETVKSSRSEKPDPHHIDDDVLAHIIKELYSPKSPFLFGLFSSDTLGKVYEQFLGTSIFVDPMGGIKITESLEVKKSGGVYYTPSYIVEYIVDQTLAPLLAKRTPQEVGGLTPQWCPSKTRKPITILDPACGSGAFLLVAYQKLLDWHCEKYLEEGALHHHERLIQMSSGEWRLSLHERKRILITNIYGLDLDQQAVEVTKLSLLLKLLEGECDDTQEAQLTLFQIPTLLNLKNNIKVGNALIGSDAKEPSLSTEHETDQSMSHFDWETEFQSVKAAGGFHAIVGNPPYRRERDYKELLATVARYEFGKKYSAARMDLWYYFVHQGLAQLHPEGYLTYIVNAYWMTSDGAHKLIRALEKDAHIEEVFLLGKLKIFKGVSGQHMIFRLSRGEKEESIRVKRVPFEQKNRAEPFIRGHVPTETYEKSKKQVFHLGKVDFEPPSDLLDKLQQYQPLGSLGVTRQGIAENPANINRSTNKKHGELWNVGEGVFALTPQELEELALDTQERSFIRDYHDLCDIGRYYIAPEASRRLIYATRSNCPEITVYPRLEKHLRRFKPIMDKRRETQKGSNQWWHLHWPRDEQVWESQKILSVQMGRRPQFAVTHKPTYVGFSINVFIPKDNCPDNLYYLTAILNSRLLWYWFKHHAKRRGVGIEINGKILAQAPIPTHDPQEDTTFSFREEIIKHARRLTTLKCELRTSAVKPTSERAKEVQAIDQKIDRLVYKLYELSEDQISVVETNTFLKP